MMEESTRAVILLILIMLLLIVIALAGSNILMKRAIRQIITIFRDQMALNPQNAKFANELGIKSRGLLQFKAFRDYKPSALQLLMRSNIVQATEEGKLFLSEEALSQTRVEQVVGLKKKY